MSLARACLPFLLVSALAPSPAARAAPLLDDPLEGATKGTRSGGTFAAGGWKVTGKDDYILWHIPTVSHGAVEWDVKGLIPGECRAGMEDKIELFHMYDYKFGNSDTTYSGGYRENPYKHFLRKIGCIGGSVDAMEVVWKIGDAVVEPDTAVLAWDPAATYHFREEWGPDGAGNTVFRIYRSGVLIQTSTLPGNYAPAGHSVRMGASNRRDAAAGASLDAVYSNVKVFDLDQAPPAPPVL